MKSYNDGRSAVKLLEEPHNKKEDSKKTMINVTIVTPFGTQAEYNAFHIRLPGSEGDFGVLPEHIPFLTTLRIGLIHLDTTQGKIIWAVSGGFVEVLNNKVTILAESAEQAEQIDRERAEAALQRAQKRLSENNPLIDIDRAKSALLRAVNRLNALKNY